MNDKLQKYFEEKEQEAFRDLENAREQVLDSLGLFERIDAPKGQDVNTEEYPYFDGKYFKKVYFDITDEEYKRILDYEKQRDHEKGTASASVLKWLGWIVIFISFIAGLSSGSEVGGTSISLTVAMIYWLIGIISGTVLIGLGKIIELLESINVNTSK